MTIKRIFSTLVGCWVMIVALTVTTGFAVWNASTPMTAYAVLGTSTISPTAPTPSLAPYPVFTVPSNPAILADEYALYNPESGKTLLASQKMSPVAIASTTKLMTVYLVVSADTSKLDDYYTVSTAAVSQDPTASVMGLVAGEQITMRSLLYGTLLVSGGDAASQLAEIRGGELLGNENATPAQKVQRFLREMNAEAKALHMFSANYTDPTGLDSATTATANDVAKIMAKVADNDVLRGIIGTADITVTSKSGNNSHELHNSNRLLADAAYSGMIGGKTGFTDAAGHCLAAVARRNGITLVVVILNTTADTTEASAQEARKLLDIGYNNLKIE